MKNFYIFVYGTLKKNCSYHYLLKDAEFIGKAITKEKYSLFLDRYPLVVKQNKTSHIKGEVYKINEKILTILDEFEGYPDEYYREKINVLLEKTGEEIEAWIYFFPTAKGKLIKNGEYIEDGGENDFC